MSVRAIPQNTTPVTPPDNSRTESENQGNPVIIEVSLSKKLGVKFVEITNDLDFLHVPLFNIYFKCKQNVFFNTEDAQAKHFEAAGNFLLTPVRYLLTGRTIQQIDAGKVEKMDLSFSYAEDSGLTEVIKTVVALLSLPISLILGSALKGISYINSSVREKHRIIEQEFQSTAVVDNTEIYRQFGVGEVFSNEILPHENYPAPAPSAKQITQMNTVRDVAALLTEHNIPHWMDYGTLLGARRHGKIIPWDTDVDLGILAIEFTNALNALRRLDPQKYEVQDWSCSRGPNMFIRVLIKEENCYLDIYTHFLTLKIKPSAINPLGRAPLGSPMLLKGGMFARSAPSPLQISSH